ncbi:cell wall / vacuolar inhibitor of fructosidase 1-like [Vicia villosa]|uniref:cell wall / vacuolar inhibitor of fructosidase 1-like n=1 Tax=Vicia villosa TaxID=3911 RepID=UPI00273B7974|nr:cell wall / vacuolar inhibitor of fructosidase 1-like [Vicia villosa]
MLKLFALFVCTTFVVTHSRVIQPNSAQTIHNTCLETPYYDQCMKYLTADPKSSTADVSGLALIMVDAIKSEADIGLNKINQLIGSSPADQKAALKSCVDQYNAIITTDVPQAIQGLQNRNPKLAMDSAVAASHAVAICDKGFSGKSPINTENLVVSHASTITSHICRQLVLGGGGL